MSFYNMLFGANLLMPVLVKVLNLSSVDIPRFRDAVWDGTNIIIVTQAGGDNRDSFQEGIKFLTHHPCYVRDEDEKYDPAYANFYFSLPTKFEYIRSWLNDRISQHPSQKWEDLLTKLKNEDQSDPTVQKVTIFCQELAQKVNHVLNNKDDPQVQRAAELNRQFTIGDA